MVSGESSKILFAPVYSMMSIKTSPLFTLAGVIGLKKTPVTPICRMYCNRSDAYEFVRKPSLIRSSLTYLRRENHIC